MLGRRRPAEGCVRNIGKAIADRRNRRKLSQGAAARAAGLDESTLSRIERGDRVPKFATLERIAEALGTTPGALLRDAERIAS